MKVTVRLYRQHDMDLLSLYMNDAFDFTREMKLSVFAMVRNEPYEINVPSYSASRQYLRRMYHLHIIIPESAQDVIKKLAEVRKGQTCSFFKAAMRACLSSFPYGAYFGGDGFTLSKAEETELVNAERQEAYDNKKKKETPKPKKTAAKPAKKAPADTEVTVKPVVEFPDGDTLPEPIPFENLPIPETDDDYSGIVDDDEGMALFDAIDRVAGGSR